MSRPPSLLIDWLKHQRSRVIGLQRLLTAIPALGPENGGQGEELKARLIEDILSKAGIRNCKRLNSPDPRVESGIRPNIICHLPGNSDRTLWLFAHLDVVPAGNPAAWHTEPFQACEKDGFVYGRGVEDNQQAICSMLILAEALKTLAIVPDLALGLVFMADEELDSKHGLQYILEADPGIFKCDDLYIVPDGGSPDASLIEIAEKSQLWLKFTVTGKQCHASMPDSGLNAFLTASELVLRLNKLNAFFSARNSLFSPPYSTFVPTRHENNVDAVNILPGSDSFYMDCRLLPDLTPEAVITECKRLISDLENTTGCKISMSIEHIQPSTSIPPGSAVIALLENAIEGIYGIKPKVCGIGGATAASFLREAGLPAVVWSCLENTCHQPDERSSITATLNDAAVFASILTAHARS